MNTYKRVGAISAGTGGGGGESAAYVQTFVIGDWVPVASNYRLQISNATHLQGNAPMVQVFELVGGDYLEVTVSIDVSNSGIVTLRIPQVPDLRFSGKCIIN
jgi:hypothetical protein